MTPRRPAHARAAARMRGLITSVGLAAARACRWGIGGAQALLLVGLVVFGLGPLLWLAKSAITPTNDTISPSDGAVPARRRVEQPAARPGRTSTSAATSGTRSCSRSARGSRRSSSRRPAASRSRCCGRSTRASSWACCSRRSSSRRSCCSCRSTSRSCTRRSSTTRSSTATGRSGCPPARAPSTSCS